MRSSQEPRGKGRARVSAALNALIIAMVIFGAGIFFYPTLADWYNTANASRTIQGYNEAVERQTEEERARMLEEAQAYNQDLTAQTLALGGTINTALMTEERQSRYESTLSVDQEGLIGHISIPKIGIDLPIGHGTSERVLQMEIGHYEPSSLPVGGASTHSVLTGHTGLPSARLFTNLDKLEEGDTFQVTVLDQVLTYEVCDIQVVLPTDVDSLRIEEGQDLCTLLTCTPYGINSHRLLVTGRRVPTPEEASATQATGWWLDEGFKRFLYLLPVFIAAGVVLRIVFVRKRAREVGGLGRRKPRDEKK